MQNKDSLKLMKKNARVAGTIIHEISSVEDGIEYVTGLCKEKKLNCITSPDLIGQHQEELKKRCASHHLNLLSSPLRNHLNSIDIALTWANHGIAETGTIMLKSDLEDLRIATMLSEIHVAMLPVDRIRMENADIESDLDTILKSDSPSYMAFITGPSRTADIERVLAIGVHGPVELHLLFLEDGTS